MSGARGRKSTSQVLEATRATDVVFSPNGEVCAFYQDDKIKLWKGSAINRCRQHVGMNDAEVLWYRDFAGLMGTVQVEKKLIP